MVKGNAGYTMAEVMMVVAIVGIIALVAQPIMTNTVRFFMLQTSRTEIQQEARVSLDIINRNLRQAVASSVTIDQASGQPGYSRITFETLAGETISFFQSGKKLMQTVSAGGSTKTATHARTLRYLAFTYPRSDDPTIVSVAITMEKAIYEGRHKALELSIEKVRVMN